TAQSRRDAQICREALLFFSAAFAPLRDFAFPEMKKAGTPLKEAPALSGLPEFVYRFPRQNPQRWGRCAPSPAIAFCNSSLVGSGSCGFDSTLGAADCGAGGVTIRGSLLGPFAAVLAGSVAVARADNEEPALAAGSAGVGAIGASVGVCATIGTGAGGRA